MVTRRKGVLELGEMKELADEIFFDDVLFTGPWLPPQLSHKSIFPEYVTDGNTLLHILTRNPSIVFDDRLNDAVREHFDFDCKNALGESVHHKATSTAHGTPWLLRRKSKIIFYELLQKVTFCCSPSSSLQQSP